MTDYLFRGSLEEVDPHVSEIVDVEAERQYRKLILIPSESQAPVAVRQALGSPFQNIYAEGYPDEETRWMREEELLDFDARLAHYRRYSDPRYYKGVEYANVIEALARRRCAEAFATNGVSPDDLYVNVQPLSGAPANNAIYHALVEPGETIMGMNLLHGGHLTHGSSVNRSGKFYNAVHYTVDPDSERIDYDQVAAIARETKPKFIIAGYSSYPWSVDWARFKEIAREVGAFLFADVAHVAGLIAGGAYPSPVGYADVITFTTHKSLMGPRGAVIITTSPSLARKIDRAVFPGEQGGPHMNGIAAMAVTFKLAQTEKFAELQHQIVENCVAFTNRFAELGFRIPYGGTDTHMMNLDVSTIAGPDGTTLSGDQAARILDIAGVVVNRNTIPGDKSAADPNGIRMGTPWVTQRGLREEDMTRLAELIGELLQAAKPFALEGRKGDLRRAKVDFAMLERVKSQVREMAEKAGIDFEPATHGYPHFYYRDDQPVGDQAVFALVGERVDEFLNFAVSSDVEALSPGDTQPTCIFSAEGSVYGVLEKVEAKQYRLTLPSGQAGLAAAWLRDLSDGYIAFDDELERKLPGPVVIRPDEGATSREVVGTPIGERKPYFVEMPDDMPELEPLPAFEWHEPEEGELRRTPIYEVHKELGGKLVPFAGWEMPVRYGTVLEEHLAVRQAAGLFDVAHMGVYQAEGPDAAAFLNCVVGNDISGMVVGDSVYTHLLDPNANVIDDLLVYRRAKEKFLVVVNAANDDKDWAWLNAVREGRVLVDRERPWARAYGRNVRLRNLRDPQEGEDMRVDIALQGPKSREILLAMGVDDETRERITGLKRTQLTDAEVGGFDLIVSRTGYTGERMAFELFVHPDRAAEFFQKVLEVGKPFGLLPIGLGARDSLRTEAGLPLYGHEMGGEDKLGVGEAGFSSYVKTYKPWFIGRKAFLQRERGRKGVVSRFRFNETGVRVAHPGDPVLDRRGRVVGYVTSCAIDKEGFLTGQAYVDLRNAEPGTTIYIYQSAPEKPGKAPAELEIGDRTNLPNPATIVSRFP